MYMQRIALATGIMVTVRITHALCAQGWEINHKRVARLTRLDNLLAIRKRRFAPVTTDSKHDLEVSINVGRDRTWHQVDSGQSVPIHAPTWGATVSHPAYPG